MIREATFNDIDNGLLDVFIEGYRYHQNGRPDIFLDLSEDELKADLINNFNKFKTLVILVDNKIVGYLSYDIKEKHSKKLHVDQLIISEELRGRGLGKKLMEEVKRIGIEENCDRIELDCWTFNTDALGMYDHIGFQRQRIMYDYKL